MKSRIAAAVVPVALLLLPATAMADDWVASQLRGSVLQLVSGQWVKLGRGDIVPDSRAIRTTANGQVTFTRGKETLELRPNTQIEIHDRGGVRPFTTVNEMFGSVAVEAEVRNVLHFAVETPYLAAVVKGTRFVVTASKNGGSVAVNRGHVGVENKLNDSHVTISVGQSAKIDLARTGDALAVAGPGKLPDVIGADGKPLPPAKPKPTPRDDKKPGPPGGPAGAPPAGPPKPAPGEPDKKGPGGPAAGGPAGPGGPGGGASPPSPPSPPAGGPPKP